jgi:hypothetical protein
MAENPDRKSGVHGKFAPSQGDLRFVLRDPDPEPGTDRLPVRQLRILQRWEWSYTDARFAWYDVPLVGDEDEEEAG